MCRCVWRLIFHCELHFVISRVRYTYLAVRPVLNTTSSAGAILHMYEWCCVVLIAMICRALLSFTQAHAARVCFIWFGCPWGLLYHIAPSRDCSTTQ